MDNYLTTLYYARFKITEREAKLMSNYDWEDNENGKLACVRNDQSITEVREQGKVINHLIEQYIEKIKKE